MIEIENVSKVFGGRYGEVQALNDITLSIAENEFVTIVGRSGCGKSTLLRIIAGLISPTDGQVTIKSQVVTGTRRDVALMFQRSALLPWRNALENVMLPVEIRRFDRSVYQRKALDLLELVGLKGFEKRLPHELSGGMQQRVALCRSLIQEPLLLLMDEPFAALDVLTREELTVELQRICQARAMTVVFVTHSVDEAVILADRVVVMTPRPGEIQDILNVNIPRPRKLGLTAHAGEISRCSAELHELLSIKRTSTCNHETKKVGHS